MKKQLVKNIASWCLMLTLGLFISDTINNFVIQPIIVEGKSMESTFHDGQKLTIEKISYHFSEPKRYDVIVFPRNNSYLIKRIIGLPGENIYIDNSTGKIFINGQELKEDYGNDVIKDGGIASAEGGINLAEGHYFVIGDNRNNSRDSRSESVGTVSFEEITGHVLYKE